MSHNDDHQRRQARARALEQLALQLLAKELLGRQNVGKDERDRASALLAELEP